MKKLLSLIVLLLCAVVGVNAANVTDLVVISSDYTFIADDITSNGTVKLTANTLYDEGHIFAPTANTVATNKGNSTIGGVSHLNSLRLKNTSDQLAFKVSKSCKVTFYSQSHSSRGIQVGSSAGGTEFGSQPVNTTEWTVDITKGGTVYLSSYSGDFYFAGFTVVFTEPSSLSFATTSGSADLSEGTSYVLPALTKSPESISVTYSSSDETVASVNPSTGAVTLLKAGVTTIKASFAGNETYSKSEASFELTVTNSAAADIDVTYDISGIVGIIGVAPDAFEIQEGQTFTVPANYTLYVEGKTLTGWNDGKTTYAIGETITAAATDMTLTPVFTENTVSLSDRTDALTLTFEFQKKNGAPAYQKEGIAGLVWVTQATVAGHIIDVPALLSTSPGKFANKNWDDWCQLNNGTTFTIPSAKGAVVTIEAMNVLGEGDGKTHFLTIDGSSDYSHAKIVSYTVASTAETIDLVIGEEGSYYRYIKVVFPMFAMTNKTWNMSDVATQTFASTAIIDNLEYAKDITVDGSNKSYGEEFSASRRAKTGAAGNKTSRFLHFRVAGNSKITVYGMSGNSSNQRNIVIDANGTELLNKKLTGDVLNKVETIYFGDEQDIYLYSTDGGINIYGVKVEVVPTSIVKSISSAGYATLCSEYPLDFTGSGLTAYIATVSGDKVSFSEVTSVPANTGVLVKGTAGEKTINVAESDTDVSENVLKGVLADTPIAAEAGLVLMGSGSAGVAFYKNTNAFTVGANTAYIPAAVAPARQFIGFDFDEATAIKAVESVKAENAAFNLRGQRVKNLTKGLYIVNGQKVVK